MYAIGTIVENRHGARFRVIAGGRAELLANPRHTIAIGSIILRPVY